MEDLKFKDVAHMYLGCPIRFNTGGDSEITTSILKKIISGTIKCKPILFPLSAMTDEQKAELKAIRHPYSQSTVDYTIANVFSRGEFLWLLRNRFNVFNLPESEYIDATKFPVNPYSKP